MRHLTRITVFALGLSLGAQPVLAADFSEPGTSVWLARTQGIVAAFQNEDDANIGPRLKTACNGLTGELAKHGNKMPYWAMNSQQNFCAAADVWTGKMFAGKPCKSLKAAMSQLDKANPAKDPAEVVKSAADLKRLSREMLRMAKEKRLC